MQLRYIYSACIVIETPDITLCCDPWFTPGIYDGSWFQYPPLSANPIEILGQVDAIYLTHIHPDHYDFTFLRQYLHAYPNTQLLSGKTHPPFFASKMHTDGFTPEVITHKIFGD